MKCENCGNNNVNFHYTSNINGNVTEKNLCSECAGKLGYASDLFFDTDRVFENMLSAFFGRRRALSPWGGFGFPAMTMTLPRLTMPRIEIRIDDGSCGDECGCGCEKKQKAEETTDPELVKRRELNALNEQMRKYAEAEEFEKAAEIRDRIKKMREEDQTGDQGEQKEDKPE